MKINEVLQIGREALSKNGVEPREARLLLAFAMGINKEELIKFRECTEEQYEKFMKLIERRAHKEPYAYIVGYKEFMKLSFKVDTNVLIPREDTEILVQEVIDIVNINFENYNEVNILDMCTGSGCIGVSLAKYIEKSKVTAVDISSEALQIAKENANLNEVLVNFVNSNLFQSLDKEKKFDIIVSNPPYIKTEEINGLQDEVKKEPEIALDGGENGLYFYKNIIELAPEYLNNSGFLVFESGFDQAAEIKELMQMKGFKNIKIVNDFGGNNRVVIGNL